MRLHRKEIASSQQELTTLAECTMFRPVNPLKSQNTMLPSASSSMSIPPVVVSSLLEAGTRQSRFETITHDADARSPDTSVLGHPESEPRILCHSP